MSVYSRVLVAVDLSSNSLSALKEALKFPREGTKVTCFYVVPEGGEEAKSFQNLYGESGAENKLLENYALPELEDWLSDLDFNLPDKVDLQTKLGDPAEEILEKAEEGNYDLIVVGTHGRSGFERYWMGSVAEAVIRRAPCPVLTVRTEDPEPEIVD